MNWRDFNQELPPEYKECLVLIPQGNAEWKMEQRSWDRQKGWSTSFTIAFWCLKDEIEHPSRKDWNNTIFGKNFNEY